MRNLILLAAGLISVTLSTTACGSQKNTEDYVSEENLVIYSDTSYPEEAIASADSISIGANSKRFSYALNGTTVELLINDTIVSTLYFYYTPPAEAICVRDFDLDGYDDIFIPFEDPVNFGSYYCYDPEKNEFEANEQLNTVGKLLYVDPKGVLIDDRSDDTKKSVVEYQWIDKQLKAMKKTETYTSSETGNKITDIYTYDENGYEILTESIKG